jgi:phage internal scaffolding protein
MEFRTGYNYDFDAVSRETGLLCADESMTQQHFHDETKIDNILDLYSRTGILPSKEVQPVFADLLGMSDDYHDSLNLVLQAQESFYNLPAHVRERFNNDPSYLMRFLDDEANRQEAIDLGLILVDKPVEPLLVKVFNESPADLAPEV